MEQNWERIEEIFLAAAELREVERANFLDAACHGDAGLFREVESLLRADRRGEEFIGAAIGAELDSLLDDSALGARLGAYRVEREIGRGGMGAVYLAERDDDQYHKQVAIKVVKRGMDTSDVLGRFRHERQILAGLDHPYIARLIDGGTTPDGRPFFVMEHVEGQTIDRYCRSHDLDIEARLRLFLRVCEAVSYAHRGLVVHRDLKPGNILVTADGIPKLLDFGVAKLLMPGIETGFTATAVAVGPITPEYASPEQVLGLAVTTATDVYSLGAILYELLTGTRAQRLATRTPAEIERVVCEIEPARPSMVARNRGEARRLRGDLDNIILMAMRKERDRRYQSVDQFADDITRYLDGLPLVARQSSLAYRAGKFVRRHRLMFSAVTLAFASLIAGVAIAITEARQADSARRVAEAQRHAADRERARAEAETRTAKSEQDRARRRLAQMLQMADRSLNDVHAAIERLPGATEARRRMVAATLKLLEDLSRDGAQDDQLQAGLSAAYRKVADVQGYPMRPNLGDSAAAMANYEKAIHLIDPLLAKAPDNPQYLLPKLNAEIRVAELQLWIGQRERSIEILRSALPLARKLAQLRPRDLDSLMPEAAIYGGLANAMRHFDTTQGLDNARQQTRSLLHMIKAFPDSQDVKTELAAAYSQEAGILLSQGEDRQAVERYRASIALREGLVESSPADVVARRGLMISYANLGATLGSPFQYSLGDAAAARDYYGKALAIARDLATADSTDRLAQYDLASGLVYYASLDTPAAETAQSLTLLQQSESILEKLLTANPASSNIARTLALAQEYAGHRLHDLGRGTEALVEYRRSLRMVEKYLESTPSDLNLLSQRLPDEEAIAEELAAQGDHAAVEMANKAIAHAEQASAPESERDRLTGYVAEAYRVLGSVQARLGNWSEARIAAGKAVAGWRQLKAAGSKRIKRNQMERAEALLRECSLH